MNDKEAEQAAVRLIIRASEDDKFNLLGKLVMIGPMKCSSLGIKAEDIDSIIYDSLLIMFYYAGMIRVSALEAKNN